MMRRWSFTIVLFILAMQGCEPAKPVPPAAPARTTATAPTGTVPTAEPTQPPAAVESKQETPADKPKDADKAATTPSDPSRLAVACASDLRFVMPELQQAFRKQHPDVPIEATFGSSGNLFAQISNDAPVDVFLSADIQYPQKLAEQGLTVPDSLFKYAIGHIVVWVRKESPLDVEKLGIEVVKDPSVMKVAIANPKLAPYGRAAEAALKSLKVYDAIQDKLVLGENIAQTAQFAESGAADVAILAMSIAVAPNFADKGKFWKVPVDAYPRLEQGGVILKNTKHAESAKLFCDFLKSEPAKAIFAKFGFVLPETE